VIFEFFFKKYVKKIQVSLKVDKNNGTLHKDQNTFFITSHAVLLMTSVADRIFRENQNTHFMFINFFFFFKLCHIWDNVEKFCKARQATDDNMARDNCMLDSWRYKLAQYVKLVPVDVTVVAGTCLSVTLYVHCLSCLFKPKLHCHNTFSQAKGSCCL